MIFYDCSTAPSPRRARMFIAEKGLKVDSREVSLARNEQFDPAFLEINPRATVPVLITEEGNVLNENLGIAAYLERLCPEPPLIGTNAEETGEIWSWTATAEQTGGIAIAEALRNGNPHMKGRALPGPDDFDQIPELARRGMARSALFFDRLDAHLDGRDFIATERFTLADITCFVFVDFARVIKLRVDDKRPNLNRWYQAVKSRPSAQM
ncbi:glutathione binding-like protein [Shimia biformata]|uniref:glutathione binding-like protein n=1 Tax=Shimia biformata TaxID=1294299 RepID=UPI0019502307